jgi:MoxR-like ATPase
VYNSKEGEFKFKPGPVFSNIILIDEINRAPAKNTGSII